MFICDEELWQGTAQSAEGHLSGVLWAKAKEEGLKVEVNRLDADSSSAKGFRQSYSNEQESKIILCGGNVGRAHWKKLEELKTKSSFSSAFIALHKREFPSIESVKCCCVGKNHTFVAARNKPVCGCIGPGFIQNAKQNHYCALVHAGNSPDKYRQTILALGKYHCREIFMNQRRVPAAFIHSLNVAVKSVKRTLMDFMQNSNVPVSNILVM